VEVVFGGLVLLVPLALLGAVFAWAISAQKKRDQAWANVAERLGLAATRQQIWGLLEGQSVQLRIEVRGSGKHRST